MKRSEIKEFGAFTVIQPWAHIILHKGKNVENRRRTSHYRGTVAIHASKTKSSQWFENAAVTIDPDTVTYGAIVGFANLVDVIVKKDVTRKTKKWFAGKYGYVLEDVVILKKPVKATGARGLWKIKGKVLRECLAQLSSAQIKKLQPFEKV